MKRVIGRKSLNTETALEVAVLWFNYKRDTDDWKCRRALYRTKGGIFFMLDLDVLVGDSEPPTYVFRIVDYDEAYKFVLREGVMLYAEGIFPSRRLA